MNKYYINISKDARHYFRTDQYCIFGSNAEMMHTEFKKRFPEEEGFLVTLHEVTTTIRIIQ